MDGMIKSGWDEVYGGGLKVDGKELKVDGRGLKSDGRIQFRGKEKESRAYQTVHFWVCHVVRFFCTYLQKKWKIKVRFCHKIFSLQNGKNVLATKSWAMFHKGGGVIHSAKCEYISGLNMKIYH